MLAQWYQGDMKPLKEQAAVNEKDVIPLIMEYKAEKNLHEYTRVGIWDKKNTDTWQTFTTWHILKRYGAMEDDYAV